MRMHAADASSRRRCRDWCCVRSRGTSTRTRPCPPALAPPRLCSSIQSVSPRFVQFHCENNSLQTDTFGYTHGVLESMHSLVSARRCTHRLRHKRGILRKHPETFLRARCIAHPHARCITHLIARHASRRADTCALRIDMLRDDRMRDPRRRDGHIRAIDDATHERHEISLGTRCKHPRGRRCLAPGDGIGRARRARLAAPAESVDRIV